MSIFIYPLQTVHVHVINHAPTAGIHLLSNIYVHWLYNYKNDKGRRRTANIHTYNTSAYWHCIGTYYLHCSYGITTQIG